MTAPMNTGTVIRADGTVPFDEGVPHPHVKAHIVQHLVGYRHDIAPIRWNAALQNQELSSRSQSVLTGGIPMALTSYVDAANASYASARPPAM